MNCHLLVPDLFWPAAAGRAMYRELGLTALETLLARGRRDRTAGSSLERWLAAAFSLPAGLPLAPFASRGEGREPGDQFWLHADPVHLKVHGDRLVLADVSSLDITAEEAREFTAALSAHFAPDGIAFEAPHPRRWYARTAEEPRLVGTPTAEVAARNIDPFLPCGADAARWRKIANEAQMVLHAHPRNEAREARGALPVNSVWFWGAGRTGLPHSPYDAVWSSHPLATGLALASRAGCHALPASAAALLGEASGDSLLIVADLLPATAFGDLAGWRDAAAGLDRSWLAPLLAAVDGGVLQAFTLHGLGSDYGYTVTAGPSDRFRFWRRRRPLQAYAT